MHFHISKTTLRHLRRFVAVAPLLPGFVTQSKIALLRAELIMPAAKSIQAQGEKLRAPLKELQLLHNLLGKTTARMVAMQADTAGIVAAARQRAGENGSSVWDELTDPMHDYLYGQYRWSEGLADMFKDEAQTAARLRDAILEGMNLFLSHWEFALARWAPSPAERFLVVETFAIEGCDIGVDGRELNRLIRSFFMDAQSALADLTKFHELLDADARSVSAVINQVVAAQTPKTIERALVQVAAIGERMRAKQRNLREVLG